MHSYLQGHDQGIAISAHFLLTQLSPSDHTWLQGRLGTVALAGWLNVHLQILLLQNKGRKDVGAQLPVSATGTWKT